jgi:large subunit ribosomal protein L4
MYRGAMQAILSELVRQERLIVVDKIELDQPKTRLAADKLAGLGFEKGLIVTADGNDDVYLATRNIPGVYMMDVSAIDPVSLVGSDKVIMTVEAVEKIQEWLG